MTLLQLLHDRGDAIVEEAFLAMERSHLKSYEQAGMDRARARLRDLYRLAVDAIADRQLGSIVQHAESVASERFAAGFGLWEVQTAFNVLEEAIWTRIIKELPPTEYAEALGLVGTVLGAGKDALARAYVSLASKSKSPALDLQSLFSGSVGA
ncbi:MAG: hypothetical protein HY944_02505 [Gemmatimonadetes bacterium]|nr:hypothetical protein [Gemmatimonadota bacterium]